MKHLLLIAALFSGGLPLCAQPVNVQMSLQGSNPEELTIAINPTNPDNLIAGANLRYFYHSQDGGRTWTQGQLPQNTYGDPCVLFGPDGRAYYAHLTVGWDAITVRYSDDGGATWSSGVKLRGPSSDSARPGSLYRSSLQDKEWMTADLTRSRFKGNIYASWTDFTKYGSQSPLDSSVIVFARSTDRGESFEPFVRVSDIAGDAIDSDNTMEGAVPAVGPDGEIYLAWAGPAGLYFDRSFDGGQTWGKDTILTPTPGGWDFDISGLTRCNGLPVTICDVSDSPHKGTIYINWIDFRNGDADVFIMKSTDRGDTWSAPIRVNDDPAGNGKEQFFTWAAVDPITGELSVTFYDRRAYSGDSTDVYLCRSLDGGNTFTQECISESPFVPNASVFFGDYICVAAYSGRVRVAWARMDEITLRAFTAITDSNATSRAAVPRAGGMSLEAYPNPVSALTGTMMHFRIQLPAPATVSMTVHDAVGRTVATLAHSRLDAGAHDLPFEATTLAAGMYFCRAVVTPVGRASWTHKVETRFFVLFR